MNTFIVVLHFGDQQLTEDCINSILKCEKEYEEIIIVDNDKDSRFEIDNSKLNNKKIKIIINEKNLGYAGGMNMGIKYALSKEATYILLINNDTIFENSIVTQLLNVLEKEKKTGIVAPVIKFIKNKKTIYDLGGKVNMVFGRTKHYEVEMIKNMDPHIVNYASGCCLMIKREVFEKIGLLDNDFFLYYEDVDFCLRAKKAGFSTYVLPQLSILHKLSSSVGKNSSFAIYHQTKSSLLFGRKHLKKFSIFNYIFIIFQSFIFFIKNPTNGIATFHAIFNVIFRI